MKRGSKAKRALDRRKRVRPWVSRTQARRDRDAAAARRRYAKKAVRGLCTRCGARMRRTTVRRGSEPKLLLEGRDLKRPAYCAACRKAMAVGMRAAVKRRRDERERLAAIDGDNLRRAEAEIAVRVMQLERIRAGVDPAIQPTKRARVRPVQAPLWRREGLGVAAVQRLRAETPANPVR